MNNSHQSSVVLCRCLFLPSLAPHNAPTNNTNTSGVSDGAVLSGMGTGKNFKKLKVLKNLYAYSVILLLQAVKVKKKVCCFYNIEMALVEDW